ncbi:MAG: 2-C-methyl-D-erythritol 2,4-cyclodiphosphate synthase [Solitalea-like symbiont of Acarus siro]
MILDKIRIGFGFDTHRLEKGDGLFIGGISVKSPFSAIGHSDADVLLHAICDALLGAANLGDIGVHFSNKDDRWKGIRSTKLLEITNTLIKEKGFSIVNIDSCISLELPKIVHKRNEMQSVISNILEISTDRISIKATTNEKLGFIGRNEGISAYANVLLYLND